MTIAALLEIVALCLAVGGVAGFLAGLFGIGGGMIMVAALAFALPLLDVPAAHVMHVALATSLACIVLTAIASTRAHTRRGSVIWISVAWLAPGLVCGGVLGAMLAGALPDAWLRIGFAAYCFVVAALMFAAQDEPAAGATVVPRGPLLSVLALPIGAMSALVGIGGGSMLVPLLIRRGSNAVRAVGTSAACGIAVALAAAAGYATSAEAASAGLPAGAIGFVHVPTALLLALASTFAARHGVRVAHRLAHAKLSRAFAVLLAVVGALMLLQLARASG